MNKIEDEYVPKKLSIKTIITVCAAICTLSLCLSIIALGTWVIVCLMDDKPPIEMITFRADNAIIGEKVPVTIDAIRTRNCEYRFSKIAIDSKGRIIFESHGERPVNGPTTHINQTDYYPIDRKAAPGLATFHLYAFWRCPNNIVQYYKPLKKEYSDTFELTLKPGDKDLSGDLLKEPEDKTSYEEPKP